MKDREIQNYKDQLSKDKIKSEPDPVKRKQKEEIKQKIDKDENDAYSKELINGELKVQVGKGVDITDVRTEGWNYFYILFHLEGTNEEKPFISKPIKYFNRMSFQWSAKIPLINWHPKDLGDEFNIKIYASKGEYENSSFVGEVYWRWKSTLDQHNEYTVSNNFDLTDQYNSCAFGKVQGKIFISSKFVPAGASDSNFNEEGEGKESIKKAQSHAKKNVQLGPMTKLGDLTVEISKGRGFDSKIRHILFLKLASKTNNKEKTKSVKDTTNPEFNEKILIPVYKRETEDIPTLVIQDVDPDAEDILWSLDINFAKIANTNSIDTYEPKWYSFIEDKQKEIEIKLIFKSVNYKEEKPKPKPVIPNKKEIEDKNAEPPKFSQFLINDSSIPDPKDTGKFRDEFPSEPSEKPISEYEHDADDPPAIGQFNIKDDAVDVQQDSGNFDDF